MIRGSSLNKEPRGKKYDCPSLTDSSVRRKLHLQGGSPWTRIRVGAEADERDDIPFLKRKRIVSRGGGEHRESTGKTEFLRESEAGHRRGSSVLDS